MTIFDRFEMSGFSSKEKDDLISPTKLSDENEIFLVPMFIYSSHFGNVQYNFRFEYFGLHMSAVRLVILWQEW